MPRVSTLAFLLCQSYLFGFTIELEQISEKLISELGYRITLESDFGIFQRPCHGSL